MWTGREALWGLAEREAWKFGKLGRVAHDVVADSANIIVLLPYESDQFLMASQF